MIGRVSFVTQGMTLVVELAYEVFVELFKAYIRKYLILKSKT